MNDTLNRSTFFFCFGEEIGVIYSLNESLVDWCSANCFKFILHFIIFNSFTQNFKNIKKLNYFKFMLFKWILVV